MIRTQGVIMCNESKKMKQRCIYLAQYLFSKSCQQVLSIHFGPSEVCYEIQTTINWDCYTHLLGREFSRIESLVSLSSNKSHQMTVLVRDPI